MFKAFLCLANMSQSYQNGVCHRQKRRLSPIFYSCASDQCKKEISSPAGTAPSLYFTLFDSTLAASLIGKDKEIEVVFFLPVKQDLISRHLVLIYFVKLVTLI